MPRYFGFFGDGYDSWGDAIDKTASFSNLHFIEHTETHKLKKIGELGHMAVINISPLLWEELNVNGVTIPSAKLRTDAAERFSAFYYNTLSDYHPIAAFLISDEPWRRNKNFGRLSPKQVTEQLNIASSYIHSIMPNVPTLVCASGGEFDLYDVPKLVDWLGMYRYSYNTNRLLLGFSLWNLVRKKEKTQQIMAIVDSYADQLHPPDQQRIFKFNVTWQALIKYYKKDTIAVCPFLYQSPQMGDVKVYGADVMPLVRLQLAQWGTDIKNGREV